MQMAVCASTSKISWRSNDVAIQYAQDGALV
ncbi:hypothetical protein EDP1_158 [Pseudomonas putida S610]|nr:hypothetical protein EDP1_158 [Pseudomonas putida S610]